jgi:PEP-CTERM motif
MKNTFKLAVGIAFAAALANASITYTCDATIGVDGPAGLCTTLNTTIAGLYSSTFTSASLGNVNVYIKYGSTGLASSLQYYTNVSYTSYVNALISHEGDANDVTAVASLGGNVTNPVVAGDGVALTSALESSLGLTSADGGPFGISSITGNPCTLLSANCYNTIITVTNAASTWYYRSGVQGGGTYDFFSAVEHETDEVLGTSSCITGSGNNAATITTSVNCTNGPPTTGVNPADLFRYVGNSTTRSYLGSANGSAACFSINGGTTDIACYNNSPNGADYGDWDGLALRIQNAYGTPGVNGTDITNDGGSEIAVLDAVGYNLNSTATPEPATFALLGASLLALGFARARRRNKN